MTTMIKNGSLVVSARAALDPPCAELPSGAYRRVYAMDGCSFPAASCVRVGPRVTLSTLIFDSLELDWILMDKETTAQTRNGLERDDECNVICV